MNARLASFPRVMPVRGSYSLDNHLLPGFPQLQAEQLVSEQTGAIVRGTSKSHFENFASPLPTSYARAAEKMVNVYVSQFVLNSFFGEAHLADQTRLTFR